MNSFIYKDGFVDYRTKPGPNKRNWHADAKLDLGLFRCPSDTGYSGGFHYQGFRESGLSSYDHCGNSYAANIYWVGVPGGGCLMESNSPYLRPVSRIPNPANTLYYEENCGRFAFLADPQPAGDCGAPELDVIHGWHGRDWNFAVAFADAHGSVVKMKGTQAPRLSEYPELDYYFWHCVITRGEGWQKDTLPSPTVPTGLECP